MRVTIEITETESVGNFKKTKTVCITIPSQPCEDLYEKDGDPNQKEMALADT